MEICNGLHAWADAHLADFAAVGLVQWESLFMEPFSGIEFVTGSAAYGEEVAIKLDHTRTGIDPWAGATGDFIRASLFHFFGLHGEVNFKMLVEDDTAPLGFWLRLGEWWSGYSWTGDGNAALDLYFASTPIPGQYNVYLGAGTYPPETQTLLGVVTLTGGQWVDVCLDIGHVDATFDLVVAGTTVATGVPMPGASSAPQTDLDSVTFSLTEASETNVLLTRWETTQNVADLYWLAHCGAQAEQVIDLYGLYDAVTAEIDAIDRAGWGLLDEAPIKDVAWNLYALHEVEVAASIDRFLLEARGALAAAAHAWGRGNQMDYYFKGLLPALVAVGLAGAQVDLLEIEEAFTPEQAGDIRDALALLQTHLLNLVADVPVIESADASFQVTSGGDITWLVSDASVDATATYTITRNTLGVADATQVASDTWVSGTDVPISYYVDATALVPGTYRFFLELDDGLGYQVQDKIFVVVTQPELVPLDGVNDALVEDDETGRVSVTTGTTTFTADVTLVDPADPVHAVVGAWENNPTTTAPEMDSTGVYFSIAVEDQSKVVFPTPVTFTLPAGYQVGDDVNIYSFDEITGLWVCENLPVVVDLAAGTATAYLEHFSFYAAGANRNPVIDGSEDLAIIYGEPGHVVSWNFNDPSCQPDARWEVYINGQYINSGTWSGAGQTQLSAGGWNDQLGPNTYTIHVWDGRGGYQNDTVLVTTYNDPPTVNSPADLSYQVGTSGHTIAWTILDESTNGTSCTVFVDGQPLVPYIDLSWISGESVLVNVDGLSVGTHSVNLVARDGLGEIITDAVLVTVEETTTYDFSSGLVGWTTDGYVDVISTYAGLTDVVRLQELGGDGVQNQMWQAWEPVTSGSLTFKAAVDVHSGNELLVFQVMYADGTHHAFNRDPLTDVRFDRGDIKARLGTGTGGYTEYTLMPYTNGQVYEITVMFDCTTMTYSVLVDGVVKATEFGFVYDHDHASKFRAIEVEAWGVFDGYLDDLAYSWATADWTAIDSTADYAFTSDIPGAIPGDWAGFGNVALVDAYAGQGHALHLDATIPDEDTQEEAWREFAPVPAGTVTFRMAAYWEANSILAAQLLYNDGTHMASNMDKLAHLRLENGMFRAIEGNGNGWGTFVDLRPAYRGEWYTVSIAFDATAGTYDVYIDGVCEVQGLHFLTPHRVATRFRVACGYDAVHGYIDDVDFSWTLADWTPVDGTADYSFTSDSVGTAPAGWTTGGDVQVVADYAGRAHVTQLDVTTPDGDTQEELWREFAPTATGTVTARGATYSTGSSILAFQVIYNDGTHMASNADRLTHVRIQDGWVRAIDGDGNGWGTLVDLCPAPVGEWLEIETTFDCATQTYDVRVDGVLLAEDFGFLTPHSVATRFRAACSFLAGYDPVVAYVDDVDFSWTLADWTPVDGTADYSFTSDSVGAAPAGWTTGGDVQVVADYAGRAQVAHLDATTGGDQEELVVGVSGATSGVVSFQTAIHADGNHIMGYNLLAGMDKIVKAKWDNSILYAMDGNGNNGGSWVALGPAYQGEWVEVTFAFDCATATYDVCVDGTLVGSDFGFLLSCASIDGFRAACGTTTAIHGYIDEVDFSWL